MSKCDAWPVFMWRHNRKGSNLISQGDTSPYENRKAAPHSKVINFPVINISLQWDVLFRWRAFSPEQISSGSNPLKSVPDLVIVWIKHVVSLTELLTPAQRRNDQEPENKWESVRKKGDLHSISHKRHKRWTNRPSSWSRSCCCQHDVRCPVAPRSMYGERSEPRVCSSGSADEELTSSGTMAAWEAGRGCHRPGDRHTMVFDRGVVTPSGGNLRPGPGSDDRVRPGLQESPCGRVRLGHQGVEPFRTLKTFLFLISHLIYLHIKVKFTFQ